MKLLWVLLTTVLVALLLAVLVQSVENCTSPEDENEEERDERVAAFRAEVFNSVCVVSDRDGTGQTFRNQTRFNHGVITTGFHFDYFAVTILFSATTQFVRNPPTSCSVLRENVTWCVRIAYLDGNIETCVSIDDAQQLVFESTCDAQLLNLERHLSLPTDCGDAGSGCLGLKNLDWIFKDAYFTRIVKNESCSGVTFIRTLTTVNRNTPPKITQLTDSPIRTQPSETVVIRAEVTSPTAKVFVVWYDSSTSYDDHLQEDPYCDPNVEQCQMDTHTYAPRKRLRRVRSYFFSRVSSTGCLGPDTYSLESYLIVDNATVSDSGNYTFSVTATFPPRTVQEDINVVIECDWTSLFQASCNTSTIVIEKGKTIAWICQLNAPTGSNFTVMLNNMVLPSTSEMTEKESVCDKEPHVYYHVENNTQHVCYKMFTIHVVVCAAEESVEGNYYLVWGQDNIVEGSRVSVKLAPTSECDWTSPFQASCNTSTIVIEKGKTIAWICQLNAPTGSNFKVMLNKMVLPLTSEMTEKESVCDKEPHVYYHVENNTQNVCYKTFTIHVVVCAAGESVEGNYSLVWGQDNIVEGSRVSVKLAPTSGGNGESVSIIRLVYYIVPVVVLIITV